ncbi:MAG TPA: transglutaminase domain-containing protein [Flavobacterium sp.]|uniref:transglutaminase domain-containing protein n=1 Tax=Flavobacterium sp. TaxID=239 RepID=UPI002C8171BB|nr:transglutaminase domain-containing protein [Flavobacterium sp.]HSD15119.1 transglutaminase domain-containing protein [Flavobacterium sp.]
MNWSKSLNNLVMVGSVLCCIDAYSQNTIKEYKVKYPDYNELILNDIQSYKISIEDDKLKIFQDNLSETMILSDIGIHNNKESFTHSDLVKLVDYEAYSVVNDKGKEKKIKVTQTNEKFHDDGSVFHSAIKEKQVIFPNLETGAKKVLNYTTEFVDPHLLHKFVFGSGLPIENSSLEITTDKNITIGYKIFNDPENKIEFTKTEKKGKIHYKWTLKDIKPLKSEEFAPGFLYFVPHIDVYIKDYTVDGKKIDVLDDVAKLYAYYRGFVGNLNKTEDPALKALVEKITADKTTESEKVKSIYYWVKDNIKYVAFEQGYEGFIPREAKLVYERKFGDCKDMASIITAMSRLANINNVYITWIGTREIPYSYSELATPAVDDHMIATYKRGNEYIFLDGTDKETEFGSPSSFIQGKEALVDENGTFKVINVPVVASAKNEVRETLKLKIDNDVLSGNGTLSFYGYNKGHYLMQIGDATGKTRFEMIKSLVLKGNNKFNLKEYTEANITDKDKPYEVNYNFELENYVLKADDEIYVNLNLDKAFESLILEEDRKYKIELDFLTYNNANYELEIPKGYTVSYLPKNTAFNNDLMDVEITYEQKENKIILNTKIKIKKILFEKNEKDLWNQSIKNLKKAYNESIILKIKK